MKTRHFLCRFIRGIGRALIDVADVLDVKAPTYSTNGVGSGTSTEGVKLRP